MRVTWYFGDGETSFDENPVHIYRRPGLYTVVCEILSDIVTNTVQTYGSVVPYGTGFYKGYYPSSSSYFDFSATPREGKAQLEVRFTLSAIRQGLKVKEGYIRVYDWSFTGGINVSKTDTCLRCAINPSQGIGWSIYDDVYQGAKTYRFPYPEGGGMGVTTIITDDEEQKQLVVDSNTFQIFEMGLADTWRDGDGEYSSGSEVETTIHFKERNPPIGASAKLRHSQTHMNIKPWFKDRRNTSDYGNDGLRTCFESDSFMMKDSLPDVVTIAKSVPKLGQIVYDRHYESESLQLGANLRGAPWRFIKTQQWYNQIDTAGSPEKKYMSEYKWSDELSTPLLWIARNKKKPLLDAATGSEINGTISALAIGPDGYSNSAIAVGTSSGLSTTLPTIDGDFTIRLWLKSPTIPLYIIDSVPLILSLQYYGGNLQLVLNDGVNLISFLLNGNMTSWTAVTITREGSIVRAYENETLLNTASVTVEPYSGHADICTEPCSMADLRILERAISDDAVAYLYKDMTEYKGNATCPNF